MKYQPKTSIIILTLNSEKTIGQCLKAITELDYPRERLEVLLLDNGSSDNTTEIIESYGYTYSRLPDLNLSELRNSGADISTGDIIAYVDSDCIVAADWLVQVSKWFVDPKVGLVGNEYILPRKTSVLERNWYNKSNFAIKYDELIPAGNMAMRKEYFVKLGGFNNTLLTGEDDYILKTFRSAGYKTISDHTIKSVHLGNAKTLYEYFKKETWYGLGMLGTLRIAKLDKPLIATVTFFGLFFSSSLFWLLFFTSANNFYLIAATCTLLCGLTVPMISAIDRVYRKQRKGNLIIVAIIFIVFFSARLNSLLFILGLRNNRFR